MLLNSLGRVLVASGLVAVTSFMASTAAFAGTSGTVTLSSSVPTNLTITVSPLPAAGALNLAPTGNLVSNVKVATITAASTNGINGLMVTATSTGTLTGPGTAIPFTVTDGTFAATTGSVLPNTGTLPAISSILTTTNSFNAGTAALGTAPDSSIFIGYTVPTNQITGLYGGSILFTAADL